MSLTDHELAAVEALKTRIEHEFGVSMTDRDYMRFLRARSLDAESAYVQAKNYLVLPPAGRADIVRKTTFETHRLGKRIKMLIPFLNESFRSVI